MSVQQAWELYQKRAVAPLGLEPEQAEVVRLAFFSGAFTMLALVRSAADITDQQSSHAAACSLQQEMREFIRSLT